MSIKKQRANIMKILNGSLVSQKIFQQISTEAEEFKKSNTFPPGLAVFLVGDDPASAIYVKNKIKACERTGFYSVLKKAPADIRPSDLKRDIGQFNESQKIHGILVQLPLPASLKKEDVLSWIDPKKDVDGLTLENKALLWSGQPRVIPCTALGIISLLKYYEIPIKGQNAVVVGRSQIVGLPMCQQLLAEQATVTVLPLPRQRIFRKFADKRILWWFAPEKKLC